MSSTVMTSSNSLTVKKWEAKTWLENIQRTIIGHAFTRGSLYFAPDFLGTKNRGDQLTYAFAAKLTGMPVGEGGTLTNNTESLNLQNSSIVINVCRIGVENPNNDTIEQQRTLVEFEDVTRTQMSRRVREFIESSFFYQLAGSPATTVTVDGTTYTGSNLTFINGLNSIVAPTTNRIVRAGGAATDQALTSSDTMTLDLIDAMIELAETGTQPLERLDGDEFDLYVHPYQLTDLKRDTTGKIQWYTNQLAGITGGDLKGNYIDNGIERGMLAAGRYNNVNIYSASRVAIGANSSTSAPITTVRRAVMLGRNAATFASPYGGRLTDKDVPVKYFFQLKDFDYYKAMEARMIYGMKKLSGSNLEDQGVIVCSTYAAAHTS